MRWAFMGLATNEFEGARFSCSDVDVAAGDSCTRTGEEVLRRLSFGGETPYDAMVGLLVIIVSFNLLAYGTLRYNKRTYEKMNAA